MAEEQLRIELDYTYTYDQFTVFFYGDRVFAGKKDYSIGQCCIDVMNLDESILDEMLSCVLLFGLFGALTHSASQTHPPSSPRSDQ